MRLRTLVVVASAFGFALATLQSQSAATVLTHVTVIDGTGAPPKPDMTVVIQADRIVAVGPERRIRVPDGAQVVDGAGKFLIPGLSDMHVHLGSYDDGRKALAQLLSYGITGARDMASTPEDILRLRRDVATGVIPGPGLVVAGPILQGPLPFRLPPLVRTVTDADARQTVGELQAAGVDFIKVGDTLTRDAYMAIADESTKRGLPFAGHLPTSVSATQAAMAGQRSIEHFGSAGFRGVLIACSRNEEELSAYVQDAIAAARSGGESPDAKVYRAAFTGRLVETYDRRKAAALFALFASRGTWQVPTWGAIRGVWNEKRGQLNPADAAALDGATQKTREMFNDMRQAGVKFMAGSDLPAGDAAPPLHDELVALVDAGMTPMQALQSATRNPAEFLGRLTTEGTIEVGKRANLVLLDGNPLTDIRNTRRVTAVVASGKLLPRREAAR